MDMVCVWRVGRIPSRLFLGREDFALHSIERERESKKRERGVVGCHPTFFRIYVDAGEKRQTHEYPGEEIVENYPFLNHTDRAR
eukprot:scaffold443_cov177-Amphora_coffeaeformis.AAC.14